MSVMLPHHHAHLQIPEEALSETALFSRRGVEFGGKLNGGQYLLLLKSRLAFVAKAYTWACTDLSTCRHESRDSPGLPQPARTIEIGWKQP